MLETYFTRKFHLSSEIEVVEVEKPSILLDFGRFSSQIPYVIYIGNLRKTRHFQLPPPISPSSSGIFEWNKFLTCLVMSQLVRKPSLKEIGAVTKKWRVKKFLDPPLRTVLKLLSSHRMSYHDGLENELIIMKCQTGSLLFLMILSGLDIFWI